MDAQVLAAGYVEALAAAWAWVQGVVLWTWFVPALVGVTFAVLIVVTLCQVIYFRLRGWTLHEVPGQGTVVNRGNGGYAWFHVRRDVSSFRTMSDLEWGRGETFSR